VAHGEASASPLKALTANSVLARGLSSRDFLWGDQLVSVLGIRMAMGKRSQVLDLFRWVCKKTK